MNVPGWLQEILDALRGNPTFMIVVYLGAAVVVILLLFWFFQPAPRGEKMKESRRRRIVGQATVQPNPTNGMEYLLVGYPVVYRLLQEGEHVGTYVKDAPGPRALLRLGDTCYKVLSLRQLTEKQIEEIEKALQVRKRIPFQGAEWDVLQELSLNVEVVAGSPPYFPGKEGMIDYKIASKGEDELILLENPYIPNKPSKLRTWTGSLLEEIFLEEFEALSREAMEEVEAG